MKIPVDLTRVGEGGWQFYLLPAPSEPGIPFGGTATCEASSALSLTESENVFFIGVKFVITYLKNGLKI